MARIPSGGSFLSPSNISEEGELDRALRLKVASQRKSDLYANALKDETKTYLLSLTKDLKRTEFVAINEDAFIKNYFDMLAVM